MCATLITSIYFNKFECPDPVDGKIFAIETTDPSKSIITLLFERLYRRVSQPLWMHSHVTADKGDLPSLKGYNFCYRLMKFDRAGICLSPVNQDEDHSFWLSSSSEIFHSEFFDPAKKAARVIKELSIQILEPFNFIYGGKTYQPEAARPSYFLEIVADTNYKVPSILFDRLLHRDYHRQWQLQLPGVNPVLSVVIDLLEKRKIKIFEYLSTRDQLIVPLDDSSNHYLMINKRAHSVEAFMIYGKRAYCLTNFNHYRLVKKPPGAGFGLVKEAIDKAPALFSVFEAHFEFPWQVDKSYLAFKLDDWQPIQEKILEIRGTAASYLSAKYIDGAVLTFFRTVNMFHKHGVQLGGFDLNQLYWKKGLEDTASRRMFVIDGAPYADPKADLRSLAVVAYNLWVRYLIKTKFTFFIKEEIDDGLIAQIITEIKGYIDSKVLTPFAERKFSVLLAFVEGKASIQETTFELDKIFQEEHFGFKMALVFRPEPDTKE
jgi:hypothetical protein